MKKNKNKIIYILLFLLLVLTIYLIYKYNIEENFKDMLCIQRTKKSANTILLPILRLITQNIDLQNECENPYIIISSFDEIPKDNIPFIYYDGEHSQRNIQYYNRVINNKYCIGCFVTNLVNKHEKTYYLPLFLDQPNERIENGCPIVRKFTKNQRDKLAVYIAHHSPPHRDKFFKVLHAMDNTVEALGEANNTRKVELPSGYLALANVYKDYKFVFAMENTNDYGYITEKIANAYDAGVIPIYWGTEYVKEIFNIESFIYINDYPSFEECAKDIISIANDPIRYEKMRNAPIFNKKSSYQFWKYYNYEQPSEYVINVANELKQRLESLKRV